MPLVVEQIVRPIYAALAVYALRAAYGWLINVRGIRQRYCGCDDGYVWMPGSLCSIPIRLHRDERRHSGVPYIALVYWYARGRVAQEALTRTVRTACWRACVLFIATLWLLAYCEELLWDRGVWHERAWLFAAHGIWGHSSLIRAVLGCRNHALRIRRFYLRRREIPNCR